jgi:cyclophilin family peptidyl-prolyl cis-trans isomerase/HEAT repeat protein
MNIFKFLIFSLFVLTVARCVPPSEEVITDINLDFTNPTIQQLYNLQNQGQSDSLYPWFSHKDPTYRYVAALAFASIRDSLAIDSLSRLLYDPVDEVRTAAAYALGQIGHINAESRLIEAFDRFDTVGVSKYFNAAILEAIGKCGSDKMLSSLATISTYQMKDTSLMEGQAWGIYRFALRNKTSDEGTSKMLDFVTNPAFPNPVRFIASNYLARAKDITIENGDSLIAPVLAAEADVRIRMALVIALGKTKTEKAANALLYQYNVERDYRVRCNIIRALANFDYLLVKPVVSLAVKDPSTAVSITAATYFKENGISEDAATYWQMAKEAGNWQAQMALYGAATKYLPVFQEETRKYLNWEIKRRFETSTNPYEKSAALQALSNYGWNYRYIKDTGYNDGNMVVRSGAVSALADVCRLPNYTQLFGTGQTIKRELAAAFIEAIQSGDAGMASIAASVLRDPKLNFRAALDSLSFLSNSLRKYARPQDLEAYLEIKQTIDFFNGNSSSSLVKPRLAKPIDWKAVFALKPETKVVLKTNKGNIVLKMMPDRAPGSVANFLNLTKDGFFNGKKFHRVVPNFVIQGGCPRGDGFGSLDFTIRSELPYLHYDNEGFVGMASAGNHTESSQFFITHSPTPHLDGNYTIFARVIEGMDIVHAIQIGDAIQEVTVSDK